MKKDKDLKFLGLSTCGFCRRARSFLEEGGWSYSYVEIDKLQRDKRLLLKEDVKKRFTSDLLYPILLIDNEDFLKGFRKEQWVEKLE